MADGGDSGLGDHHEGGLQVVELKDLGIGRGWPNLKWKGGQRTHGKLVANAKGLEGSSSEGCAHGAVGVENMKKNRMNMVTLCPDWVHVCVGCTASGVFPLSLLLAIAAFGGSEGYFNLAIVGLGAFGFIIPKY